MKPIQLRQQDALKTNNKSEKLEIALSAAECGTFLWHFDSDEVEADEHLNRLLGFPQQDDLKHLTQFLDRVHPDDRKRTHQLLERCVSQGANLRITLRIIRLDGTMRWIFAAGKTFKNVAGKPAYLTGVCNDVSNCYKEAQESVHRSYERLDSVVQATGVGFWYTDLPSMKPSADANARRMFWVGPDTELTYGLYFSRVHPEDRARVTSAVERAVSQGHDFDEEYRLVSPMGTGEVRWVRSVARAIPSGDEGIEKHFDGIVFDITKQKRVQERLEALISATTQVVYFADATGKSLGANTSWQQFTGQTSEEIRNNQWANAIHPDDRAGIAESVSRAIAEHRAYRVENRLHRFDGQWRYMKVHGVPLRDANGNVAEWVGACQDITDQRLLESELRSAVASRDEFLGIASHELKNPLTALSLSLQLLLRRVREGASIDRKKLVPLAETSANTAGRLSSLLDELLDLSRIRMGRFILFKTSVNLNKLVEEVISQMKEQVAQTGSQIGLTAPEMIVGEWDQGQISQVISNLLSNAIKYGDGKSIEVRISSGPTRREARLEVRDHGIGIPPSKHQVIFERFERAVTGNQFVGMGLGLYIVKQIVSAHGGSISVESDVGAGANFVVELPLKAEPSVQNSEWESRLR